MTEKPAGLILVTGGTGQVGAAVVELLAKTSPSRTVVAPGRSELDLYSPDSIRSAVQRLRPSWIVSSGAYTAVDAAESDRDAAYAANATAPGILAEEAAAIGAGILHLSTDYVFEGNGTRPWLETDPTGPQNVYGASKLAGEQAIAASGVPHVILRTSWVYSGGGKNFVRTMLRLLSTKTDPLRVVGDQHGGPTSAADLAEAIRAIITWSEVQSDKPSASLKDVSGVYHCAGAGETTWAGLAGAVREFLQQERGLTPPEIIPVPSSEYPTPAARPLNSRMDCSKLFANFGVSMPRWEKSVALACKQLAASDLPNPRI